MRLQGKHILVLGLGESGLAMARWCARQGAQVRVADSRLEPPYKGALLSQVPTAEFVSGHFDDRFDKALLKDIDLLALSPGLSGGLMPVLHARADAIPVVGEIELFAWALQDLGLRDTTGGGARVLAISGTNGKTTTTALTAHLCRSAARYAVAAGNISPSALDALMDAQDADHFPAVWVLELSSFQLETLDSLDADAATVLNISDDHLDRYQDLDEYAGAKARIFFGDGVQVLNREDLRVRKMALAGRRMLTFGLDAPGNSEDFGLRQNKGELWIVQGDSFLIPVSELPIAGLHNAANVMAALALCRAIDLTPVSLLAGLRSFKGLAHRVEKVTEVAGVTYYDDSKGTNVGATLAAITGLAPTLKAQRAQINHLPSSDKAEGRRTAEGGFREAECGVAAQREAGRDGMADPEDKNEPKLVLILGGDGKGQDFTPLKSAVAEHTRAVVLIGRDGPKIGTVLTDCEVPLLVAKDMEEAVRKAAAAARPGDAVVLSPACASLDMYRNYAHRAEVFIAAVLALSERT